MTPQPMVRREAVTLCEGFNISPGHRVKPIIYDKILFLTSFQPSSVTTYVKGEKSVFN